MKERISSNEFLIEKKWITQSKKGVKSAKFQAQNIHEILDFLKWPNIYNNRNRKRKRNTSQGTGHIFNKVREENYPNKKKEPNNDQEAWGTSYRSDLKKKFT